jgi:renalase
MTSCIVVGAGISALTAARELSAAGRRVVVLDEGHRAGGRMATRGIGNGIFDLGAQFFTTRSERFEKRAFRETRRGLAGGRPRRGMDSRLRRGGKSYDDGHLCYRARRA